MNIEKGITKKKKKLIEINATFSYLNKLSKLSFIFYDEEPSRISHEAFYLIFDGLQESISLFEIGECHELYDREHLVCSLHLKEVKLWDTLEGKL